jgi:hypothetical protein
VSSILITRSIHFGALAQLGERLPCTQEVSGSIPLSSTIYITINNQAIMPDFFISIENQCFKRKMESSIFLFHDL